MMSVGSAKEEEIDLSGWETFFDELGRFLEVSGRTLASANQSYASYVVERLALMHCLCRYRNAGEKYQPSQ